MRIPPERACVCVCVSVSTLEQERWKNKSLHSLCRFGFVCFGPTVKKKKHQKKKEPSWQHRDSEVHTSAVREGIRRIFTPAVLATQETQRCTPVLYVRESGGSSPPVGRLTHRITGSPDHRPTRPNTSKGNKHGPYNKLGRYTVFNIMQVAFFSPIFPSFFS